MTLERKKLLHGVVIRISGDSGKQIGAHVENVERIVDTDTGEIVASTMLPPEPLAPGADALTPLIGEVVREQQQQLEAAEAELVRLHEVLDAAAVETGELRSAVQASEARAAGLQERVNALDLLLQEKASAPAAEVPQVEAPA